MARITSISVQTSSLTVSGLVINYKSNGYKSVLALDPCATCELLKEAGFIEDFTTDRNGEPVVLFTDASQSIGYDYQMWCDFVKTYFFNNKVAQLLLEFRQDRKLFNKTAATIKYLLRPVGNAA